MPFAIILASALALSATDDLNKSAADTAPVAPKRICRSTQPTGSHLRKTICMTAAEWAAVDRQNGVNTNQTLDARSNGGFSPGQN